MRQKEKKKILLSLLPLEICKGCVVVLSRDSTCRAPACDGAETSWSSSGDAASVSTSDTGLVSSRRRRGRRDELQRHVKPGATAAAPSRRLLTSPCMSRQEENESHPGIKNL
ncbi:hypothetical protein EJB05_33674 [Eragrostis curvula]|uniref:Uncharacterized protein n=1 Tax=Eragrostis curvula TaxID=38414 RepID=A0A5J9U1V1_9POAL|nr:hypothetical protein EJB05_33674 [Eragrostis curvula]